MSSHKKHIKINIVSPDEAESIIKEFQIKNPDIKEIEIGIGFNNALGWSLTITEK